MWVRYLRHVGWRRAVRYALLAPFVEAACALPWAPARAAALRLLGARLGPGTWIDRVTIWNFYQEGLKNLETGAGCYIAPGVILDLANPIRLGDRAALCPRVTVLTHMAVGLPDHPLAGLVPRQDAPVEIGAGAIVGAGAILLCGVRVEAGAVVPAGTVVRDSLAAAARARRAAAPPEGGRA